MVLEHLDFSNRDVAAQVEALRTRQLLTKEQAEAVDCGMLERFLASSLAEEIRRGENVLREYRFTLLMPAGKYDFRASSEDTILLQGIVDCCFETVQGITVVDFKTDHVYTEKDIAQRAEHYRPQLEAYSHALEQVLEKPVFRRVVYFLESGRAVEV